MILIRGGKLFSCCKLFQLQYYWLCVKCSIIRIRSRVLLWLKLGADVTTLWSMFSLPCKVVRPSGWHTCGINDISHCMYPWFISLFKWCIGINCKLCILLWSSSLYCCVNKTGYEQICKYQTCWNAVKIGPLIDFCFNRDKGCIGFSIIC